MTIRPVALFLLLSLAADAFALKELVTVTPDNQESCGFKITVKEGDDDLLHFTVTRDTTRTRTYEEASPYTTVRGAMLKVSGEAGLILQCRLEGEEKGNTAVYCFTLARSHAAGAQVTVTEIQDYKEREQREHLIGGGTIFEIGIGAFVKK